MSLFDIFKKKSKKEEKAMTQDEKELEKAKEDIAKKGADSQTERDREDESVAAQERESGTEDSQSAKDRIDESEGAKKADEKREEKGDSVEDKLGAVFSRFESKLDQLIAKLDTMNAKETVEEKAEEVVEEKADEVYGLGNGVFQGEVAEEKVEKMSPAEVAKIVRSLKK